MKMRKLGSQGLEVFALGLGCMGKPEFYGDRVVLVYQIQDRDPEIQCRGWQPVTCAPVGH